MSDCERFAQSAQDKWATVSKSLRSFRGNEWLWVNRSGRSRKMSDCERFAQVAQRKWANEQFAHKILAKKSRILFFNFFSRFYIQFLYWKKLKKSELLIFAHFLVFGERCEWIVHFAQIKWAMWANWSLLRSLIKNERPWAIRSGGSEEISDRERIAQVAHQLWHFILIQTLCQHKITKFVYVAAYFLCGIL